MSAIAKPLIHTTAADNEQQDISAVVNVDHVTDINCTDFPQQGNTPARYDINFTVLSSANQPRTITWKFSVKATRDAKYAAAVALISTAV